MRFSLDFSAMRCRIVVMDRLKTPSILDDLEKKMVLLSGPRQVGKSWLAKNVASRYTSSAYLNYDNREHRQAIEQYSWRSDIDLLVLDELHKMPAWKNHLKGIYDTKRDRLRILVTGSARLETFRQSGDSLAGRYYSHHLLPISPAEALRMGSPFGLDRFMERGGFPEPLLSETSIDADRWRRQYLDGLIREDILDFENIRELKAITLLVELLRDRVASPLSYQALSEDVGIAPNTVKRYIEILESLYIIFRIYPFGDKIARSLLKQPKMYFFDTGLVRGGTGPRFENLVATCLYSRQSMLEDTDGKPGSLMYLHTKEGREVDFILVGSGVPELMVEAKAGERALSPHLSYFNARYGYPGVQLTLDLPLETDKGSISIRRAQSWLEKL